MGIGKALLLYTNASLSLLLTHLRVYPCIRLCLVLFSKWPPLPCIYIITKLFRETAGLNNFKPNRPRFLLTGLNQIKRIWFGRAESFCCRNQWSVSNGSACGNWVKKVLNCYPVGPKAPWPTIWYWGHRLMGSSLVTWVPFSLRFTNWKPHELPLTRHLLTGPRLTKVKGPHYDLVSYSCRRFSTPVVGPITPYRNYSYIILYLNLFYLNRNHFPYNIIIF